MRVKINNSATVVDKGTTLADCARVQNLPEKGVAIAVNNEMVERAEWDKHTLHEGDDIVILKAVCGG